MSPHPCALCGKPLTRTGKAGRPADRCPGCAEIALELQKFRSALKRHGQSLPIDARNRLRAEVRATLNVTLN